MDELTKTFEDATARPITLKEVKTTCGHGWIESWYSAEEGEPESIELTECVWLRGQVLENKAGLVQQGYLNRQYGKSVRIWRGDRPTDEQREAAKWDG